MKILLLSDPNSVHTIKWAKSLALSGIDIIIVGFNDLIIDDYRDIKNISVITVSLAANRSNRVLSKFNYLKLLPKLKKIISINKPDIVHAHYATSYGLLGALSGFKPFVLSVWGSDVFDFPKTSYFHRMLLEFNLKKADKILSTSRVMSEETKLYTNKSIEVTPFGINLNKFKSIYTKEELFEKNDIVIGTVKTLEEKYGIEFLIKAFKIVSDKLPLLPLKLLIVGGGSLESYLKSLAKELKIDKKTIFVGKVPFGDVPKYHNMLSVSVSVSNSESFGVAIIEASACEKAVVVSNIGGLPEVVDNGTTGIVVPARDPKATANAIEKLVLDDKLRKKMGRAGRERVKELYNWDDNVQQMISIYGEIRA